MSIILCSSDDGNLESHSSHNLIQWKFREDVVVRESDWEVSLSVECFFAETAEISHSRHHQFYKSIQEVICLLFSKRSLKHYRKVLSQFEVGDSFLWFVDARFLTSDFSDYLLEFVEILEWFSRSQWAYSNSDDNFIDLWNSIDVFYTNLFLEILEDILIERF